MKLRTKLSMNLQVCTVFRWYDLKLPVEGFARFRKFYNTQVNYNEETLISRACTDSETLQIGLPLFIMQFRSRPSYVLIIKANSIHRNWAPRIYCFLNMCAVFYACMQECYVQ